MSVLPAAAAGGTTKREQRVAVMRLAQRNLADIAVATRRCRNQAEDTHLARQVHERAADTRHGRAESGRASLGGDGVRLQSQTQAARGTGVPDPLGKLVAVSQREGHVHGQAVD
jgi:hypothetical protein